MTSCQICEREIKANNTAGVIAHHGYQRPDRGSGWQTDSCWGARHLPYQVSCDVIPGYIEHVRAYVENQKNLNKSLMENPPETLTYSWGRGDKNPKTLTRPEGFNAQENEKEGAYRSYQSYEYQHHSLIELHNREIRNGDKELVRMEKRLKDWKKQ